jgi:hypothetical protein
VVPAGVVIRARGAGPGGACPAPRRRDERDTPGRVCARAHRAPARAGLGAQPLGVARDRNASRQQPAQNERLGEIRQPRDGGESDPEIVVLRDHEARVVAAHRLYVAAAHGHSGVHHRVAPDQRASQGAVVLGWADDAHVAALGIDLARRASQDADLGVGVEKRDLAREPLGQRDVVGIEPREDWRPGQLQRRVQRAREPRVRPPLDPEAAIGDSAQQLGRRIRRAVVEHDELEIIERLSQHAPNRVLHPRSAVVHSHEHRNARRDHRPFPARRRAPTVSTHRDLRRKRRFRYGRQSEGG